ncbi:MAG: ABC transporter permease [Proteobacteria bacterium]|nr:ABC transporter permease [Pseudomonadota bacterium]MBU1741617.1 ABC transporter permease [Pseudomonadota bacterium]
MLVRIGHLLKKELILVVRDPRLRFIIIVPSLVQLMLFGYAANTDIRNIPTLITDRDHTAQSREFVRKFTSTGYFIVIERNPDPRRMAELMDHDRVRAVIHLPRGFGAALKRRDTARAQIIVDGTDSNTASQVAAYTRAVTQAYTETLLGERLTYLLGLMLEQDRLFPPRAGPVRLEARVWFNPNLESRNFYIPGIVATITLIIITMLTSMAVVRELEQGTLEQLSVTPLTAWEFIIGKTVPFALIGYLNMALIATVGILWFGVPFRGSVWLLFVAATFYILASIGVGLFLSTVSNTLQQAMMATFFFLFPTIVLSGFMFPIRNMPEIVRYLTYLNPLRYFLTVLRDVFLKGNGLDVLWPQLLALGVLGVAAFSLSALRLKKRLQ